jgi:hypothetical protein
MRQRWLRPSEQHASGFDLLGRGVCLLAPQIALILQPLPTVNSVRLALGRESVGHCPMGDMLMLIWWAVVGLFRSRASLEADISVPATSA